VCFSQLIVPYKAYSMDLKKCTTALFIKKFPIFHEPQGSLLCWQDTITAAWPEPD